jgi:sugar/nucleoside kinase (ribokinase family)
MVTTVQIDEDTKRELIRYASRLQAKLGRKVSFDEAIRTSLEEAKGVQEARRKFDSLFGSLAEEKGVFEDLEKMRKKEKVVLEKKARDS